jgi:hypothetical protein
VSCCRADEDRRAEKWVVFRLSPMSTVD